MGLVINQLYLFILLIWPYVCLGSECKVQQSRDVAWLETARVPHQCQGPCIRLVAMFCTEDEVLVQVWSGSGNTRTLVWQKHWKPKQIGLLEYIDLAPNEYITSATNQRFGLASSGDQDQPISVRKLFNESYPQILSSKTTGPFEVQQQYEFEEIPHPGLFIIDFCDATGCPAINVPPVMTPPVKCNLVNAYGKMKLEKYRPIITGLAKAIKTHFCDANPVKVQLWDVNDNTMDNYKLVWEKIIRPVTISGEETIIPLDPDEYVTIHDTYKLGMQSMGPDAPISVPYRFSSDRSANLITSAGTTATICGDMRFEGLPFPSEFLLTFCYDSACRQSSSDPGTSPKTPCSNETYTTRYGTEESTSRVNEGTQVGETSGSAVMSARSVFYSVVLIVCYTVCRSR